MAKVMTRTNTRERPSGANAGAVSRWPCPGRVKRRFSAVVVETMISPEASFSPSLSDVAIQAPSGDQARNDP